MTSELQISLNRLSLTNPPPHLLLLPREEQELNVTHIRRISELDDYDMLEVNKMLRLEIGIVGTVIIMRNQIRHIYTINTAI